MSQNKIKTWEELAEIIAKEKASGKTVGFTNGCFDILHLGHITYLNDAKKECDTLVIGVNGDESVKRLKKGDSRPINSQEARLEVLSALESVDYVTMFTEDTPLELIKTLTPDVIFKGGDWKEEDIVGGDHVTSAGGKVSVIPYIGGYSTTETIQRMKDNA